MMVEPKPLLVLWSKAAVEAAGPRLMALQEELVCEVTDIVLQAHSWFLHALAGKTVDDCFLATGHERPDTWTIYVKLGAYRPMKPLPDDHPDPDRRGKQFRMPEAVTAPNNEIFADYEEIVVKE